MEKIINKRLRIFFMKLKHKLIIDLSTNQTAQKSDFMITF